jgi:hypothetical protein
MRDIKYTGALYTNAEAVNCMPMSGQQNDEQNHSMYNG